MADRKTTRLTEFEESNSFDLKTFCNSFSFKRRLNTKMSLTLNRILIKLYFKY